MNILLLYFAIPIAVIIFSIALLKILRCPALVAAVVFAILLVVAFAAFDTSFLVLVIIYTLLSYITAVITRLLWELICECRNNSHHREDCCTNFSNNCCNNTSSINTNANTNVNALANANVIANEQEATQTTTIPSNTNVQVAATVRQNGNNGSFCGCWRRR